MRIKNVINNNLVRSYRGGKEVLVMGKGLGFKKKRGEEIEEDKIERIYVLSQDPGEENLERLVSPIPYEYFVTVNEVVDLAREMLKEDLDDSIRLGLLDHIYYAVARYKRGEEINNGLLWEISRFYSREFQVGKKALEIIKVRHGVEMSDSEAAFIAIHLVNAEGKDSSKMQETMEMTERIKDILAIVTYHYGKALKEDTIDYERFVTHIKYFLRRLYKEEKARDNDPEFLKAIREKYPKEYACSKKIQKYIEKETGKVVSEDELIYLTVHIRRVIAAGEE